MSTWKYINRAKGDYSSRLEHRQVMEDYLGRRLLPTEHIHHKNGIKTDNRLKNLELVTDRKQHYQLDKALGKYETPRNFPKKYNQTEDKLSTEETIKKITIFPLKKRGLAWIFKKAQPQMI